ncbi:hypothetical protein [Luteibacter sp. dw_328]|uniref:hypothetical protein n=1 Tax=Luteibacter sp. dw_328 TaxID=2719796 RepID=UPI001BD3F4D0|nr:hypothetical protein [Luteibacter sp. dw_328]
MSLCHGCADKARNLDALPLIETAPLEFRARLLERREGVMSGSMNQPVPARFNREGREAVLRARWEWPRTVAHVDGGRGLMGFQRAYTAGVLGMVIRSVAHVTGQIQERRWVGLSVDAGAFDLFARALVERNVLMRVARGSETAGAA